MDVGRDDSGWFWEMIRIILITIVICLCGCTKAIKCDCNCPYPVTAEGTDGFIPLIPIIVEGDFK